nr:hypothetical protein Q903MT_gene5856 [Picea sitchensis]
MTNGYESRGESQSAWLVNTPPKVLLREVGHRRVTTWLRSLKPSTLSYLIDCGRIEELLIKQIERLFGRIWYDTYLIHDWKKSILFLQRKRIYTRCNYLPLLCRESGSASLRSKVIPFVCYILDKVGPI